MITRRVVRSAFAAFIQIEEGQIRISYVCGGWLAAGRVMR